MNIFILRHGIAAEPGTPGFENDSERPLVPKGERRLHAAAAAMRRMELSFDLVLSSPFLRARQTAEIVVRELKLEEPVQFTDTLVPGGSMPKLVKLLHDCKPAPENVLLVGHEPYLSHFISWLVSAGENAAVEMKKGGLCKLEVEPLRAGDCAKLVWLLTPSQMELMA